MERLLIAGVRSATAARGRRRPEHCTCRDRQTALDTGVDDQYASCAAGWFRMKAANTTPPTTPESCGGDFPLLPAGQMIDANTQVDHRRVR